MTSRSRTKRTSIAQPIAKVAPAYEPPWHAECREAFAAGESIDSLADRLGKGSRTVVDLLRKCGYTGELAQRLSAWKPTAAATVTKPTSHIMSSIEKWKPRQIRQVLPPPAERLKLARMLVDGKISRAEFSLRLRCGDVG